VLFEGKYLVFASRGTYVVHVSCLARYFSFGHYSDGRMQPCFSLFLSRRAFKRANVAQIYREDVTEAADRQKVIYAAFFFSSAT